MSSVYDELVNVDLLDTHDVQNLQLLDRPDLGVTLTKLHCWKLTNYQKCVFLDADTLVRQKILFRMILVKVKLFQVIQNSDELFNRDEFSAAPGSKTSNFM